MKQSIAKFLEFNGKTLLFLAKDGIYWIAIKPVCEALKVHYKHQFESIREHPILGPASCNHGMQVPGDQVRNMVCLPEFLIYGWIFSINSLSPELLEYKKQCYEILYNHFHGTITRRRELIGHKVTTQRKRQDIEVVLRTVDRFTEWEQLKAEEARIGKALKNIEQAEINEQLSLFSQPEGK